MSFDLEKAVARWREGLAKHSGLEPGDIEELEVHLRDAIDDLYHEGHGPEEAFDKVVKEKFGQTKSISEEYRKARTPKISNTNNSLNPLHMLPTNLRIAFRNLGRNRSDSFLNIIGLTISVMAAILIYQYVIFETSYDQFFDDYERIHRVSHRSYNTNDGSLRAKFGSTFYAVAADIKNEIPEVEATTKFLNVEGILRYEETNFREQDIYFAASDFFDVFSLDLVRGNPKDLDLPDGIFLSETLAHKYFGDEDAFGKNLEISLTGGPTHQLEVRGIFKDFPGNSHIGPTAFLPLVNFVNNVNDNNLFGDRSLSDVRWRLVGWYQYVLLKNEIEESALQSKLNDFMFRHRNRIDEPRGVKNEFFLQRIDQIHLSEKLSNELKPKGDNNIILFLRIIFVTILLLGWINYINLTTAKAINRAKEVGVRKVVGSTRSQLVTKFLTESFLVNTISILMAITLVIGVIPFYHELIGRNVFSEFGSYLPEWGIFAAILITGVLISSYYPSLVLSSFKPVAILKGKFKNTSSGMFLRKGLVTFQFLISLVLLVAIYVLFSQITYMRNYDLGFNMEQTLVVRGPSVNDTTTNLRLRTFTDVVSQQSTILQATVSGSVPGGEIQFRTAGRPVNINAYGEDVFVRRIIAYDNFIDFYDLDLIAGRGFSETRSMDRSAIILNRMAVEQFGYDGPEEALNKRIAFTLGDTLTIIGVVENYAQRGLQVAHEPIGFHMDNGGPGAFISMRVEVNNLPKTMDYIREQYADFFPEDPFELFFLDDHFNAQYQSEEKYGKILALFTMIAILIACLGLLGLTSFMVRLRLKEVAVRKVLGASVTQILGILTREYYVLIAVACLIGLPLSYFGATSWLDTFAFKVSLGPLIFLIPVVAVVVITFVTIGRLSFKAATSNPVNSLKEE